LIEINRETGAVTWDDFRLHPYLTYDEFVQRYPSMKPTYDASRSGIQSRLYDFIPINIDDYLIKPQAIYSNTILEGVSFTRDDTEYFKESLPKLAKWGKNAYLWLTTQLGEPQETRLAGDFGEKEFLTSNEIQFLESCTYKFKWGTAGFEYDPLRTAAYIFVHYDFHQQVDSWDKLAQECDLRIQKEQEIHGLFLDHLITMRFLIDILSQHFEYELVKPRIGAIRMGFSINDNTRQVSIDINPENDTLKYSIWRLDTPKRSYIKDNDNIRLVNELRLFLEAETL
jgi:hypothetical protein